MDVKKMQSRDVFWSSKKIYKPETKEEEEMLRNAGYTKIWAGLGQDWYESR